MRHDDLFALLTREFDTDRCLETLKGIWQNDRYFDFASFAKTADYCQREMERAGLQDIESLVLRADGKAAYGDWVMPQAWDASSATLSLPDTGEVLADYHATPTSLVMYSAPTPPGGIEAEVMDADSDDLDEETLRGKLLFTAGSPNKLVALAQQAGAAGIISDFFPLYSGVRDSREQMCGHSRWENAFCIPRNDTGLFAFSLSPEKGDRLRALLAQGPVRLRATVDTRLYDGEARVVSGCIPGETDEEVLLYGHLYEPGALDNASGCATILTLAHCLNRCIQAGILRRPTRTLRFVLGWECVGSTAWLLAHPEKKILCALVADMVGTEAIDNTHLCIWHNPLSNFGFADALITQLLGQHRQWLGEAYVAEEKRFSVGTDNIIGDPYWGIPTVAMITEPALSYHSSMDRPERIEPDVLQRDAVLLGAWFWSAAALTAGERAMLTETALDTLQAKGTPSIVLDALRGTNPLAGGLNGVIPSRIVPGCLTLADRPDLQDAPWQPAWSDKLHLPLFWVDGKRTLAQIILLSSAEAGEDSEQLDKRRVWLPQYFHFLAENGYLSLQAQEGDSDGGLSDA